MRAIGTSCAKLPTVIRKLYPWHSAVKSALLGNLRKRKSMKKILALTAVATHLLSINYVFAGTGQVGSSKSTIAKNISYPIRCVGQDLNSKMPIALKILKRGDGLQNSLSASNHNADHIEIGNLKDPIELTKDGFEKVKAWQSSSMTYALPLSSIQVENDKVLFSSYDENYNNGYYNNNAYYNSAYNNEAYYNRYSYYNNPPSMGMAFSLSIDFKTGQGTFNGPAMSPDGSGVQSNLDYPMTCKFGVK